MKSFRIFSLIIFSALLLSPANLFAEGGAGPLQDTIIEVRRPIITGRPAVAPVVEPVPLPAIEGRVGLVLAGGGARGLYHIGVIEALEQNNIPIDYVSGTSMGAIVAALYAAGYTTGEMREIVTSGAVERWVSGQIEDRYKFHYNTRPDKPTMLSVYAEREYDTVKHKHRVAVQLPHSMVSTAQIDMALVELFAAASAACGGDFDRLMVPFRCVATDINAHSPVAFAEGDLALAVRASMSYPTLFQPVEDDKGRVLVDGGCYDNFPWRALEDDFCPDFLIGSQCLEALQPITQESRLEKQIMALVTIPTDYTLPEGKGLVIGRKVESGLLDFSVAEQTIELGYQDAMAKMSLLQSRLASRRDAGEVQSRRRAFRDSLPELVFGEGQISGLSPRAEHYAATTLAIERPRRRKALRTENDRVQLSIEEVKDHFYTLMATDKFSQRSFPKVRYNADYQDFGIFYDLAAKPELRFSIGGNLSSTAYNQIYVGLDYLSMGRQVQSASVDIALGPVSTIAEVGGRTVFMGRTPTYLDYSLHLSRRSTLHGSYGNVTPSRSDLEVRILEPFASVVFGLATSRKSLLEIGVNAGYKFISYEVPYDEPGATHTRDRFRFLASRLRFERSSLDKMLYPTRGNRFAASLIGVWGRDKWQTAESFATRSHCGEHRGWLGAKVEWEHYPSNWSKSWFTVGYSLEAVYTNHPDFGNPYATVLTAPRYSPLPHAKMIFMPQFYANRYAAVGVMPTFSLVKNLYLRGGFYALLRDPLVADEYMYYMADVSFVYHTRVGAISLSATKYDLKSWNNCYVTFNFGYPIFGKRGLYY